jgi:hypothetical protein
VTDAAEEEAAGEEAAGEEAAGDERHLVDAIGDEIALSRAQLDAGLPGIAEGTLRRRLAMIEADEAETGADEADALQLLLAEALWRQQRPAAARAALGAIRPGSAQRRLPMALLIEAETLAAFGEVDRSAGAQERLLAAIGDDAAFELRGSAPSRMSWPLPTDMRSEPVVERRPPWGVRQEAPDREPDAAVTDVKQRAELGRRTMEEARVAYVDGDRDRGDDRVALAVRLDEGLAADGVRMIEPTLGRQPSAGRLVLYGDLLRAAGREDEAQKAYRRAAERGS